MNKTMLYLSAAVAISLFTVAFAETLLNLGETAAPGEIPKWDGEQWRNAHDNVGVDKVEASFGVEVSKTNGTVTLNLLYPPIGSVTAWLKTYENTPHLPDGWVECNGQTLDDYESPYHGQVIPNLNGPVEAGLKGRFLRGHSESGLTEESQNLAHNHSVTVTGTDYTTSTHERRDISGRPRNPSGTGTANTHANGGPEARPHNYSVVWIMRVK